VTLQRLRVVGADGRVILDDRYAAGHAATIPEALEGKGGHFFAIILRRAASIAPRGPPFPRLK
jgi:hypothetical protein